MCLEGIWALWFSTARAIPELFTPLFHWHYCQAPVGCCVCDLCFKTALWNRPCLVPISLLGQRKHMQLGPCHAVGKGSRVWTQSLLTPEKHLTNAFYPFAVPTKLPHDSTESLFRAREVVQNNSLMAATCPQLLFYPLLAHASCPSHLSKRHHFHLTVISPVIRIPGHLVSGLGDQKKVI